MINGAVTQLTSYLPVTFANQEYALSSIEKLAHSTQSPWCRAGLVYRVHHPCPTMFSLLAMVDTYDCRSQSTYITLVMRDTCY